MSGKLQYFLLLQNVRTVLAKDSQSLEIGTTTPNSSCIIWCVMDHLPFSPIFIDLSHLIPSVASILVEDLILAIVTCKVLLETYWISDVCNDPWWPSLWDECNLRRSSCSLSGNPPSSRPLPVHEWLCLIEPQTHSTQYFEFTYTTK